MVRQKKVIFDRNREETNEQEKKAENKMIQATKKGEEKLFQTKTVFPFDLFPDTVTIYTTKIDIIQKEFFYSQDIMTIAIQDIGAIEVQTAPFLATIQFIPAPPHLQTQTIRYLKHSDAIKIKKIVDKLLVAVKEEVNLMELDIKKFLADIK